MKNLFFYKILHKIIATSPKSFFIKVFNTLHPCTKFEDNWHIDLLLEHLLAAEQGRITRLIINIPPRTLKSICISVFWPAWILAKNPSAKIIAASYSQALSYKHSHDCRIVLLSEWFKKYFPKTTLKQGISNKAKLGTTRHGFRFATSIGGTMTGEGADFIIIDDPQTPAQALSANSRNKVVTWFEQTLMSRLNNKESGVVVLVMQRLHMEDLAGHLLQKGGWTLLNLPMIAEKDEFWHFGNAQYKRKKGELLHFVRDNKETIARLRHDLGEYAFNAQYQQSPVHLQSQFIKREWLHYYQEHTIKQKEMTIYQSWDCAIKAKESHDYTVCCTIGRLDDKYYVLDMFRKKLEYPYLKKTVIRLYDQFKPCAILIEDKVSGQQLIQELGAVSQNGLPENIGCSNRLPIIPVNTKYDKITRLFLTSQIFESKSVFLPTNTTWAKQFEDELMQFPHGRYDDQVDAITQLLLWIRYTKRPEELKPQLSFL